MGNKNIHAVVLHRADVGLNRNHSIVCILILSTDREIAIFHTFCTIYLFWWPLETGCGARI